MYGETTECWLMPRRRGWTIGDLKHYLAEGMSIPAEAQVILYRGNELENGANLALYWDKNLTLQRRTEEGQVITVHNSVCTRSPSLSPQVKHGFDEKNCRAGAAGAEANGPFLSPTVPSV